MPEGYPLTFEHWLGAGDLAPAWPGRLPGQPPGS